MSTKTDLGEVNYSGYFVDCDGKSLISGDPLPAWDEVNPEIRRAWRAGADRVAEALTALSGAPGKVIVVTDENGREVRYNAADVGLDPTGCLVLGDLDGDGPRRYLAQPVAGYSAGRWKDFHLEGAIADDPKAKAVDVARRALHSARTEIEKAQLDEKPIGEIVSDALVALMNLGFA